MALAEKDLYLKIGRPNNTCVACQAPIDHAGKHPSVLRRPGAVVKPVAAEATDDANRSDADAGESLDLQIPSDEPRREDYCADCWQKVTERDYLGYWMARRQPPKVRKIESRKERNAGVLAWFEHLRSLPQEPDNLQAQFFLAHLLMKYGVFKWLRTEGDVDTGEVIYFRQTGNEDDIAVAAVELSDEKSLEVKQQLDEFLLQYANSAQEKAATGDGADGEIQEAEGTGDAGD